MKKKVITIVLLTTLIFPVFFVAQAKVQHPEFRNLAKDLTYEWSEEPHPDYPDEGNQLTDGIKGTLDKSDPAWVGHIKGKTREVVFDLEEKKSIESIQAHFLQDYPENEVLVPLRVSIYVSDDKSNWATLGHFSTELLWGEGPPRDETFSWNGEEDGFLKFESDATMAYARYVKVAFQMHGTQWSFIDEVEITGTDGKLEEAVSVPPENPEFLEAGEDTANINNLALLYNGYYDSGIGNWKKDSIIPQISYVNREGVPQDWLYDGVLYLGLASPEGRSFETGTANFKDWEWYLDKTFAQKGDMQQLNEAAKEVSNKLGYPDHKVKVVFMIPNPGDGLPDFKEGGNNSEEAVDWWLDEVQTRWNENEYSNLELSAMYWLYEQIDPGASGEELPRYVSDSVHEQDLLFFWIPHFLSYKSHMWEDVGFNAAAFQPNYFFDDVKSDRIEDAANIAKQYGMGVEIEFDRRILTDPEYKQRYIDYLNGGINYDYMGNTFKAYYQGGDSLFEEISLSKDPDERILYDWMYQFVNGTYMETATSVSDLKQRVETLIQEGEITNQASSALLLHLEALIHYEQKGEIDKVIKHLKGFQHLILHQEENKLISWLAYNTLRYDSDALISK